MLNLQSLPTAASGAGFPHASRPRTPWGPLPPGEPGQAQGHCTVPVAHPATRGTAYTPRTISARRGEAGRVSGGKARPPRSYRQTLCLPAHPSRGFRHTPRTPYCRRSRLQPLRRRPMPAAPPSSQPVGRLSTSRRCSQEASHSAQAPCDQQDHGPETRALPRQNPGGGPLLGLATCSSLGHTGLGPVKSARVPGAALPGRRVAAPCRVLMQPQQPRCPSSHPPTPCLQPDCAGSMTFNHALPEGTARPRGAAGVGPGPAPSRRPPSVLWS